MRRPVHRACLAAALSVPALLPQAGAVQATSAEAVVGNRVLSISMPEGFGTDAAPRGLLLRPLVVQRAPYDVTVEIEPTAATPTELPRLRRDAGTLVRYRLDREEGGSGGAEVTLTAERTCNGAMLRLVLRTQAEIPSQAMLEPAWAVLRGATCRLRDGPR